jgi:hypothetical protein
VFAFVTHNNEHSGFNFKGSHLNTNSKDVKSPAVVSWVITTRSLVADAVYSSESLIPTYQITRCRYLNVFSLWV